ncbi:MAG: hypothetical protein U0168_10325 [Nannocystaceae bacterium]
MIGKAALLDAELVVEARRALPPAVDQTLGLAAAEPHQRELGGRRRDGLGRQDTIAITVAGAREQQHEGTQDDVAYRHGLSMTLARVVARAANDNISLYNRQHR